MKRIVSILIVSILFLTWTIPVYGIYMPPSRVKPTHEDINTAVNFFKNMKWDLSNVANNQIGLTMPKMPDKYLVAINQWNMEENNDIVGGRRFYQGSGGTKVTKDINQKLKTGYHFEFFNDSTSAIIAVELYTYSHGDTAVKYIPFEDRRYPVVSEDGKIEYWIDDIGNRINEDGSPYDPQNPNSPKSPFKDVSSDFWGFKDIFTSAGSGYIKGYSDGNFKPNNKITRAEFMVMLGNVLKDKWVDGGSYSHSGEIPIIASSHWAYKTVTSALSYMPRNDVSHIFGSDFRPDQSTTREEVVAVLASILSVHKNFQKEPPGNIVLSDVNTSNFPDSVWFSVKQNLVIGYPDSTFRPQNSITRAEITAVMVRMIEKLKGRL